MSFAKSKNFQASLARSGRYLPMMRRIFAEHGLPQDLIYIALVESGFSPYARSPKDAVGIWQFIEGTAKRYGLKVNDRVDERQDPEKSTRAAARYLHDLYQQFGCWYLSAAGYNAGENRVEGVMNRHDIQDFWVMAQKKLLPEETCNYVPQIVAAALIAKDPEKYGMAPVKYQAPRGRAKSEGPRRRQPGMVGRIAGDAGERAGGTQPGTEGRGHSFRPERIPSHGAGEKDSPSQALGASLCLQNKKCNVNKII